MAIHWRWTEGMRGCRALWLIVTLCLLGLPRYVVAQEQIALTPVEGWSTVFGDQQITWHFTVTGPGARAVKAGWTLAQGERPISRGEIPVQATNDKPASIAIPTTIPPVKPGAMLGLTLTVILLDDTNAELATGIKRIWVYPTDPFADRTAWLKSLDLRLYDPDGATARRLDDANIPYTAVGNADALAEGEGGIALVGEGLSFDDYRALAGALVKAAAAGRPVLCLAPSGGAFPLPGSEGSEGDSPAHLSLRRADIIAELDKHLDATAWPKSTPVASALTLKASRDQVIGEVKPGAEGWSWLECRYPDAKSTLVVCGFGLMAHWEEGPTPRFLFARLLTYLNDQR